MFSGTIRENLKWGNENASDDQIIEACKAAQAHDFIMSFPDGYDTMLEQGGVNVSGGQKQRLCIARALLKVQKSSFLMIVAQLILQPTVKFVKHLEAQIHFQRYQRI